MKKIFWIIPLFLLFACQNEDFSTTQELDSDKSQYELTSTQAQGILEKFISENPDLKLTTRTAQTLKIKEVSKKYHGEINTRSNQTSEKIAMYNYEINNDKNRGFAIVCADKRFPRVIAFSTKGTLDELKNSDNEVLANYLNNIEDYVAILVSYRDKLPDLNNKYNAGFPYEEMIDVQYSWTTDSTKESIVYLKESITWSQSAPYNNMFEFAPGTNERYTVGCSNIATINIMAYYHYPKNYDWENLTMYPTIVEEYDPEEVVLEAAKLCKYVSEVSNSTSNPSTGTTSTTLAGAKAGFTALGYKYTQVDSFSMTAIKKSLDNCYPVYMAAGDKNNPSNSTGHAFVVRGYWNTEINVEESLYNGDLAISLGINWGNMGGFGDGWYLVEIGDLGLDFVGLNPIVLTDQGPAFSNQDWSRAVKLLTDIRPDNMD